MSVSETMSDVGRCRLCVREKPNQISVFRRNLSMRIMKLADVVIREDDWLPKTICLDCEIDIEKCFEFIARVQWADKKYRDEANQIEVGEPVFIKQEHDQFENYMDEENNSDGGRNYSDSEVHDESDNLPAETGESGPSVEAFNLIEIVKNEERLDQMEVNDERSNQMETAQDPLCQEEPFFKTQGKDEFEPLIDPLTCMKEEAMNIVDVAPSTSTNSSSVRRTTSESSIPIWSEISPTPRDKFEIKKLQKMHENAFVMDHMYPETVLRVNPQSTLDQDVCKVRRFGCGMQIENSFSGTPMAYGCSIQPGQHKESACSAPVAYGCSIPSGQDKESTFSGTPMAYGCSIQPGQHKESAYSGTPMAYGCSIQPDQGKDSTASIYAPEISESQPTNFLPIQLSSPHCSFCNIDFDCLDELNKHKESSGIFCRVCTTTFQSHVELESHIVTHPSSNCKTCNKVFFCRKDVLDHRKTSTSCGEGLECEFCKKKCFNRKALSQHRRRYHFFREVHDNNKCIVCLRKFTIPSMLREHLKVAHVVYELLKCEFCPRLLLGPCKLRDHIKEAHILSTEEMYVCSTCGKSFHTKNLLYAHSKIHDDTLLLCHLCGKPYKGKAALSSHMIHSHKNLGSFTCDCCNKHFTSKKSYRAHVRRKTQPSVSTEVYCEICGKKFKTASILKNHQRIHSGERPFKCESCGATFNQLVALRTHSRIHTGLNKYLCKGCGKSFRWKQTFDKHVKKCDGEELEEKAEDLSSCCKKQ